MSIDHAVIAPSSLDRTVACNGWIKQASLMPPEAPTEESLEGEAAHWVALQMAMGYTVGLGSKAPNGVLVTDEMIDGGHVYVDALEGLPGKMEERVEIKRIHETECWGTPDRFTWTPATKRLRVFDYKFGFEYIEVFENWQLLAYAAGIMDALGLHDQDVILELVIVQPRLSHRDGPVRMWPVSATKIRAMVNIAHSAAAEALGPNPTTKSGTHCLHCPARVNCITLQKTISGIMDFAGHADPMLSTPGDVGRELRMVTEMRNRLKARQTGLEAQAEAMLRAGKLVPFFMLEPGQSRLKWFEDVKPQEIEALVKALNPNKTALKPPTLITPTQAIKGKVLDAAVMDAYASRPPGAMKMVPDTTTKAAKVFSK
jgi:hypothetical protein